jgi:PTH1 family peptidyl-tRNA hydrolase
MLIGLGNPGREYEKTRHNFGFMLLDELVRRAEADAARLGHGPEKLATGKKNYELWKVFFSPPGTALPWLLLKPLTYMNLSGRAVNAVAAYYDIAPKDMLVAHDELDLPLGGMRLKFGGGSAGHKGINSMVEQLGSRDFYRLRLGIGKQPGEGAVGHVLGHFGKTEQDILQQVLKAACHGFMIFHDGKARGLDPLPPAQEYINGFQVNASS